MGGVILSKAVVLINGNTEIIEFSGKTLLSELINKFSIPMPCGGNHTCGKCKVKAKGALSEISDDEKKALTIPEILNQTRLSCATFALGDCEIEITSSKRDHSAVLLQGEQVVLSNDGYAIAVDIGTTTIAVYLYKDGKPLSSIGEQNNQAQFGADVITRIGANALGRIHNVIVSQLSQMFEKVMKGNATANQINQIVITGNTTMLHFLMEYDPSTIAVYPFTPHSLFDIQTPASTFFSDYDNAMLYLPPCISSYVGADMVCSIITSKMCHNKDKTTILADIGTNGEMALQHQGKLYTCSTAAGPALEGATIKMGMVASKGAIDKVFLSDDGNIETHVIGEAKATGICGSGLISLMALLVKINLIDETGMIDDECVKYAYLTGEDEEGSFIQIGDSGVVLTQRDIRQFQLAKSAICAGIFTLLNECDIKADEVSEFYICGGFGSYINPTDAAMIGLIPRELHDKVKSMGNAAGMGAAMLFSDEEKEKARKLATDATTIELSMSPYFMEQYVEQMRFGETL